MSNLDNDIDRIVANLDYHRLAEDLEDASRELQEANITVVKALQERIKAIGVYAQEVDHICDFLIDSLGAK